MIKRTFLSLCIVQFVCSNNVLSKFNYFERTLIRKNEKNKKNSKERNSKEKNEFRKNVIWSNDLVPKNIQSNVAPAPEIFTTEIDIAHYTNIFSMNAIIIWGQK
jgi:hypothetical protein